MTLSNSFKHLTYVLLSCALFASLFITNTANATTYYVATSGNDSNPGTSNQPFRSIKEGIKAIAAGDTLFIKSGTYQESINSNAQTIPTGTSWSNAPRIVALPGNTVILRPGSGGEVINMANSNIRYVIFNGLIVDATGVNFGISTTNGANHIRFQNMEIKNSTNSGAIFSAGVQPAPFNTFNEFINCSIHNNGGSHRDHGIYIETGKNLVKQSRIHHNSSFGVHVFQGRSGKRANQNLIVSNVIYSNSIQSGSAAGILLSSGDGNMAYNNILYSNKTGIHVHNNNPTNSKVYNNTVYNNVVGIENTNLSMGAQVKNNISYKNTVNLINNGVNTVLASNLMTNPSFVNEANADFHLQTGSPAINSGTTINGITNDFEGTSRPQGSNFDIGAYESKNGSGGSSNTGGSGGSTGGNTGGSTGGGTGGSTSGNTGGSLTFPASMSSPAPGATLTNSSVNFTGRHASGDVFHSLWVGTSKGSRNLFGGPITSHKQLVSGLPTRGTIYVRYWSTNSSNSSDPNAWKFTDQTYTMAVGSSSSSSTGGSTSGSIGASSSGGSLTFPASMSSPAPGATLTSNSVTFTGRHASGDVFHSLWVGTTKGGRNLFGGPITNHKRTVSTLPSHGTIYVRYWSTNSSNSSDPNAWKFTDQTYTMAVGSSSSSSGMSSTGSTTGSSGSFPPSVNSPAPNTTLTNSSVTFKGKHASGDVFHSLWVGTTKGGRNLFGGPIFNHSKTVSGLPSRGTIYVRYWSTNSNNSSDSNAWFFTDQTYTMNTGGN